jgi:O-antigen/teichoic acid export membrane protein
MEPPEPTPEPPPIPTESAGAGSGLTLKDQEYASTTGAAVLAGGLWNTLTRLLPQLYTVLASIITARYLGPAGMGRQSFIAFVELSAVVLFTGGLPIALTRCIGEAIGRGTPAKVRTLLRWAWRVEAVGAGAALVAFLAVGLTTPDLQAAWYLAGAASALAILHSVPTSLLSGSQQWKKATVAGTVTGLLGVIGIVVVLRAGAGIPGLFAVEAGTAAINLAWTSALSRRATRRLAPVVAPADDMWPRLRAYALLNTLGVVLHYIVWRRSEFLFLARYSTADQIAFYSIAFGGVAALLGIAEAAGSVFSPAVATLFGAGEVARIRAGFGRALRLLPQVSLPLAAAGLALGPTAVRVAYGPDYAEVGPILRLLLLAFPFVPVVTVSTALLYGMGRFGWPLVATGLGAAMNVLVGVLIIPRNGASGAAVANGIAQSLAGLIVVASAWRLVRPDEVDVGALARAALVSAGAGTAAYGATRAVDGVPGLAAGGGLGLVIYIMLALL